MDYLNRAERESCLPLCSWFGDQRLLYQHLEVQTALFLFRLFFPRRQSEILTPTKKHIRLSFCRTHKTTNWPCMHHVLGFSYIHAFTVWVLRHTLRESAVRPCYDLYTPLSLRFSVGRADTSPHPSHIKQSSETPHTRAISVAIFSASLSLSRVFHLPERVT